MIEHIIGEYKYQITPQIDALGHQIYEFFILKRKPNSLTEYTVVVFDSHPLRSLAEQSCEKLIYQYQQNDLIGNIT